jgi:hypothetical protein
MTAHAFLSIDSEATSTARVSSKQVETMADNERAKRLQVYMAKRELAAG